MKIKQINVLAFSLVLITFSIVGTFFISSDAQAYKCVGTPDDYYTRDVGSREGIGDKANITSGVQRDNLKFEWNESLGRCTVTIPDLDNQKVSQNADGSFKPCGANQIRVSTLNNCADLKTYATNDKPVRDDGSEIPLGDIACGGDDAYDVESFSCKQTGLVCNVTGTCDYNKVGLQPDPTSPNAAPVTKTFNCVDNTKTPPENYQVNEGEKCRDGSEPTATVAPIFSTEKYTEAGKCGGVKTNLIGCDNKRGAEAIGDVLRQILVIMTVGIGILAVGGIVYGAILYASAQDNAGQTKKAIEIITNTVIGLLLYIFMVTILNWLIPGGVL